VRPFLTHRLLNRNFVLLWQGQLVSQLGNQAFVVAMMLWTMRATGSASVMGSMLMLAALPGVFLAPVGGAFADRHSRRAIIILTDVIRGVGVLALAVLLLREPGETALILAGLFVFAVVGGVADALFRPAISAAIPDLVPPPKVAAANSLNQLSAQGAVFLGQALGGVLFELLGAPLLFFFNGLSFLFSAGSESFIRIPQELPEAPRGWRQILRTYLQDSREGFLWIWSRPGMRDFLLAASAVNFLAMPVFVLLPFYVEQQLVGGSAGWYGYLLAALSAGNVAGYLLAGALDLEGKVRSAVLVSALFVMALTISSVGLVSQPWLALAVFFVMGVATGVINISVMTLFQVTTPGAMRGRVMGLVIALAGAATPLGMGLGGLLGDLTGKNLPLLWGLSGGAIALVTLGVSLRPAFREFLAQEIPR
jgi:MFS family permease